MSLSVLVTCHVLHFVYSEALTVKRSFSGSLATCMFDLNNKERGVGGVAGLKLMFEESPDANVAAPSTYHYK